MPRIPLPDPESGAPLANSNAADLSIRFVLSAYESLPEGDRIALDRRCDGGRGPGNTRGDRARQRSELKDYHTGRFRLGGVSAPTPE
jgi:hypothetical protein